jgi:ATP-dependent helicase/nuclease subunit A
VNDIVALALRDDAARCDALDITRSWLVQAPAGSGKTSLLIQRFLALLATVERPERVVAMTFTRKAAAEMRARIVDALRDASEERDDSGASAHERFTRGLARVALNRDRQMGWRLLEQPGRLRVVTIDALATALARQAPLAAGLGALPRFVDDADVLHREAARAALAAASAHDRHWQTFLQWQDNDAGGATRLIAQMLAGRDRWPARLFAEDADALRAEVEAVLQQEARVAIRNVQDRLPASLAAALPGIAQMALDGFLDHGPMPSHASVLEALVHDRALPASDAREAWCGLADWLLTQNGTFLRAVTKLHGFPPQGRGTEATARAARKAHFVRWLQDAAAAPGLAQALHRVRALPPARFGDDAWAFVVAAMNVLPQAASALDDVFRTRGRADFAEATLRALMALGAPDDPSDLLLAIDYRLSHLLIDEFQDTSNAQLALIGRLTDGWQPGDGRTLFAVGDPMQSIYRFRQADVALFLEAQVLREVANVPVGVVELTRNFRSQREIVDWVNDVFRSVLPSVSDPARGEAAYCPACADPDCGADMAPTLDLVASREVEADAIVQRIRDAQAAGIDDIAVLVRARSHARALLPALRCAGIEYAAVDLEGLHDRLATRDLLSLARALAQPADRVAWLSVLRAPWCGLTLADLLTVANRTEGRTILEAIALPEVIAALPSPSRARVERFLHCIEPAIVARGHARFTTRVRSAWLALGGPACAGSALDRNGTDRVFALLAEHEHGGDLADFETFMATAERLFAEARDSAKCAVQVMTLHKAKGLQFGAVILPGLDCVARHGDSPLLRWKVREHDGERTLLLAPMRARIGARSEPDPVYAWLAQLDAAEEAAELGRLLYVGATRAKRRLHLLAVAERDTKAQPGDMRAWKRPRHGSALERLWDALGARLPPLLPEPADSATADAPARRPASLIRLPEDWRLPALPPSLAVARQLPSKVDTLRFDWADATAAAIGTVAHRLLAQIADEGADGWDEQRVHNERARIVAELGGEGIERDVVNAAVDRVNAIVTRTLRDPRGRWLFDRTHADAHSEWALAGEDEGRIVHVVLDRSFVANGFRYIVDFKTGAHLGGDPGAFLARELERYRPQLVRYARIVRGIDPRPVRIALYHPLVEGGWQEEDGPSN